MLPLKGFGGGRLWMSFVIVAASGDGSGVDFFVF